MSFAGNPPRSPDERPSGQSTLGGALRGVSAFASRLSGGRSSAGAASTAHSSREMTAAERASALRAAEEGMPARRGSRRRRRSAERATSSASEIDWGRLGALGAGIAIGALFGAGTALLYAPQSGYATRAVLRRRARRLTSSAGDAWDELGEELRAAARRSRRGLKRGVTRGRWKAADMLDA